MPPVGESGAVRLTLYFKVSLLEIQRNVSPFFLYSTLQHILLDILLFNVVVAFSSVVRSKPYSQIYHSLEKCRLLAFQHLLPEYFLFYFATKLYSMFFSAVLFALFFTIFFTTILFAIVVAFSSVLGKMWTARFAASLFFSYFSSQLWHFISAVRS